MLNYTTYTYVECGYSMVCELGTKVPTFDSGPNEIRRLQKPKIKHSRLILIKAHCIAIWRTKHTLTHIDAHINCLAARKMWCRTRCLRLDSTRLDMSINERAYINLMFCYQIDDCERERGLFNANEPNHQQLQWRLYVVWCALLFVLNVSTEWRME